MTGTAKKIRDPQGPDEETPKGPAASPEAALDALRRRGKAMSDEEREAYIRQALRMVDPAELADRLLHRVPGIAGLKEETNIDAQATPATDHDAHHAASRGRPQTAELLEDLALPEEDDELDATADQRQSAPDESTQDG